MEAPPPLKKRKTELPEWVMDVLEYCERTNQTKHPAFEHQDIYDYQPGHEVELNYEQNPFAALLQVQDRQPWDDGDEKNLLRFSNAQAGQEFLKRELPRLRKKKRSKYLKLFRGMVRAEGSGVSEDGPKHRGLAGE